MRSRCKFQNFHVTSRPVARLTVAFISQHLKGAMRGFEKIIHKLRKERSVSRLESHQEMVRDSSDSVVLQDNFTLILNAVRDLRRTESIPVLDERRSSAPRTRSSTATNAEPSQSPEEHSPPEMAGVRSDINQIPTIVPIRNLSRDSSGFNHWNTPSPVTVESTASSGFSKEAIPSIPGSSPVAAMRVMRGHSQRGWGSLGSPQSVPEVTAPLRPRSEAEPLRSALAPSQMQGTMVGGKSSFTDVRPLAKVLKMVASSNPKRILGRLERLDESWQPVAGILEPEQTFNSITNSLVSELNLLGEVDQYTGENCEIWIESFSGRRIKPTGKIQIRWGPAQSKPISLLFWVFHYHQERNLVLGQQFVRKTQHYKSFDDLQSYT